MVPRCTRRWPRACPWPTTRSAGPPRRSTPRPCSRAPSSTSISSSSGPLSILRPWFGTSTSARPQRCSSRGPVTLTCWSWAPADSTAWCAGSARSATRSFAMPPARSPSSPRHRHPPQRVRPWSWASTVHPAPTLRWNGRSRRPASGRCRSTRCSCGRCSTSPTTGPTTSIPATTTNPPGSSWPSKSRRPWGPRRRPRSSS